MARRLLIAYSVLGFAFLYLPIAFLVLFSFNDNIIPSLPFRGFTLQWYRELGFDFVRHDALYNSLVIAGITTVTSTVLGTRRWYLGRQLTTPPSLHVVLTPIHAPVVDDFLRDLREVADDIGRSGRTGEKRSNYAT